VKKRGMIVGGTVKKKEIKRRMKRGRKVKGGR
jgi:hypothetical protein